MSLIHFEGRTCERREGESVLDALLRSGASVSHSCKAGSCGACMLRAVDGAVPARAQAGLKDTWKVRGYFLSCVCVPEGDLQVAAAEADTQTRAEIVSTELIGTDVLRVRLRCEESFAFRAGQYVTLRREDGLARSYSIASLPEDGLVEMHVRLVPNGRMSGWLRQEAGPGTRVRLQGPLGDCFYLPGREDQPLLLAGTGTGLAPLYGVVRDALRSGHRGEVHLFHGSFRAEGFYLGEELSQMAAEHANFFFIPTMQAIDEVILERFPKLNGWRGYVCGDPALVIKLRKKLFLSGMALKDIHADAFLPAA